DARLLFDNFDTSLSGSAMLPKYIARVVQVWTQAGTTSPSRTSRPSSLAFSSPLRMRWIQKVHFSITPRARTDTSGFNALSSCASHFGSKKLKKRTVYGQLFAQYRVPTHRL